ncbi:MAG: FAD-dependent oxidoreductase [Pseudomonadota bacterium]
MHTIVIGGGLMGLTTAYVLRERGEEVSVIESRDSVALETSFANGGMLTPSMPEPWNSPGVYRHLAASLFDPRSSMKLRVSAIPSLFGWGVRFLRHSAQRHYDAACADNYALADYSLAKTREITERLGLEYCRGDRGTLSVFRSASDFEEKASVCKHLARLGMRYDAVGVDDMLALAPALHEIRHEIHAGIHYPADEHGDARMFCQGLAEKFVEAGGTLRLDTKVQEIVTQQHRVTALKTSRGEMSGSRIVAAAGVHSAALLRQVGLALGVKPVKGYSVTVDVSGIGDVPNLPVLDDSMHAGMTPLGDRLRMVGTAEFTGFDTSINTVRTNNLLTMFQNMLPSIAAQVDPDKTEPWAGLRPMSFDGKPFIGSTPVEGLFVNCGQGHLGWTMAMGSAHLLADIVLRAEPALDPLAFSFERSTGSAQRAA